MENQNKLSTFWLGFILGAIATGAGAYFFGTKKGREMLKKILELSENLEENLLIIGEELEEELGETGKQIKETLMELPNKINQQDNKTSKGIDSLLNKISMLSPNQKKSDKKFFIKEKSP
jgi:hypothetical protein